MLLPAWDPQQSSACRAPDGMQAITRCAFFKVASADTGCGGLPVLCYPGDFPRFVTPAVLLTALVCGRGQQWSSRYCTCHEMYRYHNDCHQRPACGICQGLKTYSSCRGTSGGSFEHFAYVRGLSGNPLKITHAEGCLVLNWR